MSDGLGLVLYTGIYREIYNKQNNLLQKYMIRINVGCIILAMQYVTYSII